VCVCVCWWRERIAKKKREREKPKSTVKSGHEKKKQKIMATTLFRSNYNNNNNNKISRTERNSQKSIIYGTLLYLLTCSFCRCRRRRSRARAIRCFTFNSRNLFFVVLLGQLMCCGMYENVLMALQIMLMMGIYSHYSSTIPL
jgi:hypothetical protein